MKSGFLGGFQEANCDRNCSKAIFSAWRAGLSLIADAKARSCSSCSGWSSENASHYSRGKATDPKGKVENEDFASMLCTFSNGATGTFEVSRTVVGPESQNAFEIYGTKGSLTWNFEKLNELQYYELGASLNTGYTTIYGGDRFPFHGAFVPGQANAIGFEDLVAIEDYSFMQSIVEGQKFGQSFKEAVDVVSVQHALINSWSSRTWERVKDLSL